MHVDMATAGFLFSAISTLVVLVGVFAAIRQLRYLRHGNELTTLSELASQWDTDDMRDARRFIQEQLREALDDPTFVAELRRRPLGPRAQNVAKVGNFFDLIGVYVFVGALSEQTVMFIWGDLAERYWGLLRDAIQINRETHGEILEFFEDFAMRAAPWRDSNARGWRERLRHDPALSARAPGVPVAEP